MKGKKIPVIMFTKNGGQWFQKHGATGPDAIGLDEQQTLQKRSACWSMMSLYRATIDPCVLSNAGKDVIESEKSKCV